MMKSNDSSSSSLSAAAVRLTLQVDNTSALPIFLQGRTVAILGGQLDRYTLDAKEPGHRQQIYTQLKEARRLRASLEDAASKLEALSSSSSSSSSTSKSSSYAQAMKIFQSSLPHIHQLEKLTEAFEEGGGYTTNFDGNKNDSERKTRKQQRREEMEKERQMREQQIIRRNLIEFVRESDPTAKMSDEELEYDSSIEDGKNNNSEFSTARRKGKSGLSPHEKVSLASFCGIATLPTTTTTTTTTLKRGSSYSPEDLTRKRGKHDLKRSKSSDSGRLTGHQEGKKNKRSEKPAARKDPQDAPTASHTAISMPRPSSSTTNNITAPTKKSPPPPPPPPPPPIVVAKKAPKPRNMKKCHECKNSSNRHRVCNYWKLSGFTGAKCGKVFCIDCLTSKYSAGDDVLGPSKPDGTPIEEIMMNSTLDSEWHCPSCLGTCQCNACVVQRKREEEREKNRGDVERKSQRRSAHSSYYNFF